MSPRARLWLPLIGPLALLGLWALLVSAKAVNPVLLPGPGVTLAHLWNVTLNGSMAFDFAATLSRTAQAFAIATVVGVPLGVALGSSEALYRSVEFLVDFFRSTPSSALIPLFMLFFGITDFNKVAISAFAAVLVVMFNSAYGVMNAKRTRIMAASVMGASRWRIFRDVLLWESLPQTFV
ncbi:MAG: ABC transporter permease, partial [Burkholderiaceae bacterium]